ncbi:MAG: Na+/proline symporter, partial [Candidatus Woesearchaeota archaeon]
MIEIIDWIIIAAYVAVIVGISIFISKKQSKEGFLIANRAVGLWDSICTINATKTGAILVIYVALLYQYGISSILYFIGIAAGYLLFIPFAKKLFSVSKDKYTLAQYFKHHVSTTAGYVAATITLVVMIGFLIINLIAAAKTTEYMLSVPFELAVIAISLIICLYLFFAGFNAVVKTDVIQYVAIMIVIVLLAIFMAPSIDITAFQTETSLPFSQIIGFFILGIFFPFASPDLWQRTYAVKSQKILTKSLLISTGIYIVV